MGDFEIIWDGILVDYFGNEENVVVPDEVEKIGNGAFSGYEKLKSIVLPSGLIELYYSAFYYCENLEKISIPSSLKHFGYKCFDGCKKLVYEGKFKAFRIDENNQLYCKPFFYNTIKYYNEDGKWNWVKGKLTLCENGIHYITNLYEIFDYYFGEYGKDFIICEIETKGDDIADKHSSKHCCKSIKIIRRLDRLTLINMLSNYDREKTNE